jgi:5-dehydro-4-deoxyglucarate dehydratase
MNPQELKKVLSEGLLSFPLTDFDAQGEFNPAGYARRLEWLAPYGAKALFAAGGTGEYFSLSGTEYPAIVKTAVDTCRGKVPIIAGAGGATRFAIECARAAEQAGALSDRSQPGRAYRACRAGLQERLHRRCRLQPERLPPDTRFTRHSCRTLSKPDRFQGWHWRHRADVLRLPEDG